MAVIKLVEDYATTSLRNDVRDALTLAGEQSVLLQLFHSDDTDAVPCPQCGDDIYHSPEMNCTSCYGTTFDGGVRTALKVWALYTDHDITEQRTNRGEYRPDFRSVQLEAFPLVSEHDVIARVKTWTADGTPEEMEGFYILQQVTRRSLRTGSRAGQYPYDVVGQKAQLSEMPDGAPLTRYPILGQVFSESMTLRPSTSPPSAIVQPDAKVVFFPFPFENAPGGGITPAGGARRYAENIGNDVDTVFTVIHNFGTRDVLVSVYEVATGNEVDTDVTHPDDNTVQLTFALAPGLNSLRAVIQG